MQITLEQIGDSKCIILDEEILKKYNIKNKIEISLENNCIILKSPSKIRENWEDYFAEMHKNKDDTLLIEGILEDEKWD